MGELGHLCICPHLTEHYIGKKHPEVAPIADGTMSVFETTPMWGIDLA